MKIYVACADLPAVAGCLHVLIKMPETKCVLYELFREFCPSSIWQNI